MNYVNNLDKYTIDLHKEEMKRKWDLIEEVMILLINKLKLKNKELLYLNNR